jgi:hypothetical protein
MRSAVCGTQSALRGRVGMKVPDLRRREMPDGTGFED